MELPRKLVEQEAFNTRTKMEKHMLIVMDKSTHEEHLFQPSQTNNKQFKIALTFLSAYNGLFNVINGNNKSFFKKAFIDEDFIQIRIPEGACEIESLDDEIKTIIIDDSHYTSVDYPFKIKPNVSTLGGIITISIG